MYCCVFSSSTIQALGNIVRTTLSVILAIAADGAIDKCIMLMCRCALFCVVPAGVALLTPKDARLILIFSFRANIARDGLIYRYSDVIVDDTVFANVTILTIRW